MVRRKAAEGWEGICDVDRGRSGRERSDRRRFEAEREESEKTLSVTLARQLGQWSEVLSQRCTQRAWKGWPHGSRRAVAGAEMRSVHTVQMGSCRWASESEGGPAGGARGTDTSDGSTASVAGSSRSGCGATLSDEDDECCDGGRGAGGGADAGGGGGGGGGGAEAEAEAGGGGGERWRWRWRRTRRGSERWRRGAIAARGAGGLGARRIAQCGRSPRAAAAHAPKRAVLFMARRRGARRADRLTAGARCAPRAARRAPRAARIARFGRARAPTVAAAAARRGAARDDEDDGVCGRRRGRSDAARAFGDGRAVRRETQTACHGGQGRPRPHGRRPHAAAGRRAGRRAGARAVRRQEGGAGHHPGRHDQHVPELAHPAVDPRRGRDARQGRGRRAVSGRQRPVRHGRLRQGAGRRRQAHLCRRRRRRAHQEDRQRRGHRRLWRRARQEGRLLGGGRRVYAGQRGAGRHGLQRAVQAGDAARAALARLYHSHYSLSINNTGDCF
ncbi:hypothetical protein FGB62_91g05 [Gracilaria domingensis]|nr:hypothetical protein FGB62_91g05 [Gracilaria domingensis]